MDFHFPIGFQLVSNCKLESNRNWIGILLEIGEQHNSTLAPFVCTWSMCYNHYQFSCWPTAAILTGHVHRPVLTILTTSFLIVFSLHGIFSCSLLNGHNDFGAAYDRTAFVQIFCTSPPFIFFDDQNVQGSPLCKYPTVRVFVGTRPTVSLQYNTTPVEFWG